MRIAAVDQRTVINTLSYIRRQCGINNEVQEIHPYQVKKNMHYMQVPEGEQWRVTMIQELLMIRKNVQSGLQEFSIDEVNDILDYLCISQY